MIVACFCGKRIVGATVTVCHSCMRPVEMPTVKNPTGLPQRPQDN